MPLQPQTLDVPLIAMNQSWPITAGPAGRLRQLKNAVATAWQQTKFGTVLKVQKRDAFVALPTTVRDPSSGTVSSKTILGGTVMTSYGKQLILGAAGALFALSEAASCWESPAYTCPTAVLREKPLYNASGIVNTPDSARIGSRTMYTWRDVGSSVIAQRGLIQDDDGTQIVVPFTVDGQSNAHGKVATDGTQFWTVTWDNSAGNNLRFAAYDTNGVLLGSAAAVADASGYFDVTKNTNAANSVVVIQKNGAAGWEFRTITWTGAAVTVSAASVTAAFGCDTGAIAFLRNDTGDHRYYVLTIGGAGPFPLRLWPISDATLTTVAGPWIVANVANVAEMTGFVSTANSTSATVLASSLDTTPTPQKNSTAIWTVTGVISGAAVVTAQPTRSSLTLVSRPLVLGGLTYVVGYFHSDPAAAITGTAAATNKIQQSTFHLINIDFAGTYQVCGRWDPGLAYADWQVTTDATYYFHLATPNVDPLGGVHVPLAYRATSLTNRVLVQGSNVVQNGFATFFNYFGRWFDQPANTVGIKDFSFGPDNGQPFECQGELFIPGPQTTSFTGSTFVESGIPTIPEVLTVTPGGGGSLLNNQPYEYVWVAEWTDTNGDRVRGPAAAPVALSAADMGANSKITTVGTMVHTSQKTNMMISGYRTIILGGVQSTQHYKVTSDLAPTYNADGSATWSFADTMSDSVASVNEILYTDKAYVDRFPCPPFSSGCSGAGRAFVIGYDGSVWFSGEKTEGDALWFNPLFRIPMPTTERPTAVAVLDNFLLIFGESESIYTLPIATLPDATGQGPIPRPTLLPLNHGCTGFTAVYSDGIMFSSTQGGLWTITRGLQDVFSGAPVRQEMEADEVAGTAAPRAVAMAVDKNGRLAALLSNQSLVVYDSVVGCWYKWQTVPAGTLLAVHKGQFVLSDPTTGVWRQTLATFSEGGSAITTTVEAMFEVGGVRNFKRIWKMQTRGEFRAAHSLTVTGTFDDNFNTVVETYGPFAADAGNPAYVYEFNPPSGREECSSVALKFVDSFPGGATAGMALEMVSFEIGVDKGLGRVTAATQRISGA